MVCLWAGNQNAQEMPVESAFIEGAKPRDELECALVIQVYLDLLIYSQNSCACFTIEIAGAVVRAE
jgi:hypothetical protein